ncbi:hypothetical protein YC2023_021697 [Brassica napus]
MMSHCLGDFLINLRSFILLTKVLAYDATNIKALYRRGQAYRDLGHEVSPEDETIADVLRDVNKERLEVEGPGETSSSGVVIEDITEEDTVISGEKKKASKEVTGRQRESNSGIHAQGVKTDLDGLQALRDDPEAIRFNTFPKYCIDVLYLLHV